jgi:hypothetical protein
LKSFQTVDIENELKIFICSYELKINNGSQIDILTFNYNNKKIGVVTIKTTDTTTQKKYLLRDGK